MADTPNILAERYASENLKDVWSTRGKIILEREFWIAVMKAQRALGLAIPDEAINAYELVKEQVDLNLIRIREETTKHDVKARIEVFNDLAGQEHIHKGLTSRDLTENVEQLQILRSLEIIRQKAVSALINLAQRAAEFRDLVITGRTHNVAAQPTTLGKRFAMFGEELLFALQRLDNLIEHYPIRGLKGPVGTQIDLLTLFDGDASKVVDLEEKILDYLGSNKLMSITGQVYPRSIDFAVVSALFLLSSAPSSMAKSIRLMAGHELVSEGFGENQVGSSAMPHKMNSRSCERINGFNIILKGHLSMIAGLTGDQWNEGDVSCSVVRRVVMPDSFFTIDGLLETFLNVIQQMEIFPANIEKENNQYLPYLTTTTIMMEAVKNGAGRESAHAAIKEKAVAVTKDLRAGKIKENDLIDRLADDPRLGLKRNQIQDILAQSEKLVGAAASQVDAFISESSVWKKRFPQAADYKPIKIL